MIFLLVLSGIVLAGILYVFFAPLYVEINSIEAIYRIRFQGLLSLSFFVNNDSSLAELKIGPWKRRIDLSEIPKGKREPGSTRKKNIKRTVSTHKMRSVLRSFKINRLEAELDLGDMQWNGILYPVFCWLSRRLGRNIHINFEGRNTLVLEIENNLARMSRAYLYSDR